VAHQSHLKSADDSLLIAIGNKKEIAESHLEIADYIISQQHHPGLKV